FPQQRRSIRCRMRAGTGPGGEGIRLRSGPASSCHACPKSAPAFPAAAAGGSATERTTAGACAPVAPGQSYGCRCRAPADCDSTDVAEYGYRADVAAGGGGDVPGFCHAGGAEYNSPWGMADGTVVSVSVGVG